MRILASRQSANDYRQWQIRIVTRQQINLKVKEVKVDMLQQRNESVLTEAQTDTTCV